MNRRNFTNKSVIATSFIMLLGFNPRISNEVKNGDLIDIDNISNLTERISNQSKNKNRINMVLQ